VTVNVRNPDFDCQSGAIENLSLVDENGVRHDDAFPADIVLCETEMVQELDPGFVKDGEKRIVADMAAIVEISDPDGNCGCIDRIFGEVQLDARHLSTLLMWDEDVGCLIVGKKGKTVNGCKDERWKMGHVEDESTGHSGITHWPC
jgi:hypothetical protein